MEAGVAIEEVRGVPMRVFAERPRSLLAVAGAVLARPAHEFLVCGERRVTDHALLTDAQHVAAALQARGLEPGDRVGILAANSVEWAVAFWGVVAAGGIVSAMNGWWAPDEVAYGIEHSEPKVLIADRDRLDRLMADGVGQRALQAVDGVFAIDEARDGVEPFVALIEEGASQERRVVSNDEDDPVAIFYTSGTTGRPKGAIATHRSWIAAAQSLRHLAAAAGPPAADRPPEVALATLPLFHVSGCQAALVAALVGGTRTVLLPGRFDPERALAAIEAEQVTRWSAVPTMVSRVCRHEGRERFDLRSVRSVSYGGSPAPPELPELVRTTFPNVQSVGNAYGLTESGTIIAVNTGADFEARPTSVGRPFPVIEVRIGTPPPEQMASVAQGDLAPGPIELRGPMIMPGYWKDAAATAEVLSADGWLSTGDLGYLDDAGFLYVTDRAKDMIIRGGENVYPAEIEQRLGEHPEVIEAAVIGVEDADLGETVEAHVRLAAGASVTDDELAVFVAERLARFKVPASFVRVSDPLPRNVTGKLLKNEIRALRART